jgi:peptidyl-prolyl cis-trans isomerase B (cyclophilin B)
MGEQSIITLGDTMPQYSKYPDMVIDKTKNYVAHIDTTKGTIRVNLFADRAPISVNNFVFLARDNFYKGVTFHRVIANFMIQGGDPTGIGSGGPGYNWADEPSALAIKHEKGSLSMAHRGKGTNSNGSQFFITHTPTPHLDGVHGVFGKVVDANDQKVVDAIEQGDVINNITIVES